MLITTALEDPVYYASIVVVVLISIVLHELGHAYAALWEGDTTPRDLGHLDLSPTTHMEPIAIAALLLVGFTWGSCPVNPRNFRHRRYGDAIVAAAGPAVNLLLGIAFTTLCVLWQAYGPSPEALWVPRVTLFLWLGGLMNFVLLLLNMLPLPPLDGFTVAKAILPGFDGLAPTLERNAMLGLLIIFVAGGDALFGGARQLVTMVQATLAPLVG